MAAEPGAAADRPGPNRRRRLRGSHWSAALLLLPALLLVAGVYLYPTFEIAQRTFSDFAPPQSGGLDNLRWAVGDDFNRTVFVRTAWTTLLVTGTCLLIGYPYAYLCTLVGRRTRTFLLGVVLASSVASFLVRSYAWVVLFQAGGPIADLLDLVGLGGLKLTGSTTAVVIALTQILLPLMVLPLYASLNGVDRRLVLAARSLGATPARAFRRVYLPVTIPGIVAGSLLVAVLTAGFYITPTLVGSPSNGLISQQIIRQVSQLLKWGKAGGLALTLLAVTILLLGVVVLLLRRLPWLGQLQASPASHVEEPPRSRRSRAALAVVAGLVVVLLVLPALVILPISFSSEASLLFPPPGLSLRWYDHFFSDPAWRESLRMSLVVGVAATALATLLGTAAAYALARPGLRGKSAITALLLAPMLTPIIIVAVGIYAVFLKLKLVGTTSGFVLAHAVLALPFVLVPVMSALASFDRRLEDAAHSLGATPLRTFARVTFPLIAPGVLTGAVFAFLVSLDETAVSLFIATPDSQTLPVQVYTAITRSIDPTAAAGSSLLMLATIVGFVALSALRRRNHGHI